MRVMVYILLLACIVLSMIPVAQLSLVIPALQVFALVALTNFPAVLPVRRQAKYMGVTATWFGRYPEIPIPFLIWATWGVGGVKNGQAGVMVLVGVSVALCLGVAYTAVRVVDALTERAKAAAIANPSMNLTPIRDNGARFIYLLRVTLVVGSGVAIFSSGALGATTSTVLFLCVSCAGGAAVVAFVVALQLKEIAKSGAADARRQVEISQQVDPASVVVHYSQPLSSKHLAPKKLCKTLRSEGLKTALILREADVQQGFEPSVADYVWPAPAIAHLDAYALDTISAVFYTNDAIKNGHFTRFNQFIHVLVSEKGRLATSATLPPSLAIYDAVVAPNHSIAEKWRTSASPEMAQRVVTVEALSVNATLSPAIRRCPDKPSISVHIRSESLEKETFGLFMDDLLAVFKNIPVSSALNLTLSYTLDQPSYLLDLLVMECTRQAAIINRVKPDEQKRIFICKGKPESFHNAADVLIATCLTEVTQLLATQKLVLWLGQGASPPDVPMIAKDRSLFSQQLETLIQHVVTPSFVLPSIPQHYSSYHELVEHLALARNPQGTRG